MNLPDTQYFLLASPLCTTLIGAVFIAAHFWFKAPKYLLWIGLGCILPSVALGAQSLMTNALLKLTAPWFALCYLTGAWAVAHGMLLKAHSKSNIKVVTILIAVAMMMLLYFRYVDDQLWLRIAVISGGISCLEALALPKVYNLYKNTNGLEKVLFASYIFLFTYSVIRTFIFIAYFPYEQHVQYIDLVTTHWWMMVVFIKLLVNLWFAIIVSAVTVRERFHIINEERLRDPLTKLYNRNGFSEKTKASFNELHHGEVYLVMSDIDNFKHINDTWGHIVGDEILCAIADIYRSNIRQGDVVGRFGGEEFIILLHSVDEKSSIALVERLRKKIEDQIFINNIRITASFGAAKIDKSSHLINSIEIADKHLYIAKNNGRNQVCFI